MSNDQSDMRVRVPASTSNLGAGFDVLGLGVDMYLDLCMEVDTGTIEVLSQGEGAHKLPTDERNLIAQLILERVPALRSRGFRIRTRSDIPLTRGFGSSASAIVGALALAQLAEGRDIDRHEILQISTAKEGHPDNVSASIFGGLTINVALDSDVRTHPIRVPNSIRLVGLIPHQELSTAQARAALPASYDRADVVFNLQRLSWLIAGLYEGDAQMIAEGLHDRLHQSYRCDLLPPMREAIEAMNSEPACIGAFVSGAGPGILAFVQDDPDGVGACGAAAFNAAGIDTTVRVLSPDNQGIVLR